ncbi:MAG: ABC transporter permease [Acidobacteria bacterium]|nr:ABC transporter permease [Acidobacteriota bacterium]
MKIADAVELAGRNLRESALRNTLTTTGIAVGVASLVAMVSLGAGLQQLANRRLTRSGLFNTIFVFRQQPRERGFGGRRETAGRSESPAEAQTPRRPLDEDGRLELQHVAGVAEVYPDIRFQGEIRAGSKAEITTMGSIPPSARDNDAFETLKGSFFSSPGAAEVLLRREFAESLSDHPESLIGQEVTLRYAEREAIKPGQSAEEYDAGTVGFGFSVVPRERALKVVGIMDQEPFGGLRGNSDALLPTGLAIALHAAQPAGLRELVGGGNGQHEQYASLVVRVANPSAVQQVEDQIKQKGFGAFSLLDATKSLRRFFVILDGFLGIFGSIALAVAALGIVNTLVMSVLERRREIGIMKAIGASDADVRRLFFAEAAAMGLAGGALGLALGWVIGFFLNTGTNIYLRNHQYPTEQIWSVPWWLIGFAIVFSVLVSLASGLYPAGRAARLDPVQALRYD